MIRQLEEIAGRIKELREILEIDKEQIAEAIGVDVKTYEDYEEARDDIPIGKLYLIADALNVDPTVLLIGDEPRMVDYTVVRQEKGVRVERYPGYEFTSLAYNYVGRQMEPMIVTVDPDNKKPELVTHKGQEFNYVLEGTVAVILNDKEYILKAGDSIYFNPSLPHGQKALGNKPARYLTVINEISCD